MDKWKILNDIKDGLSLSVIEEKFLNKKDVVLLAVEYDGTELQFAPEF